MVSSIGNHPDIIKAMQEIQIENPSSSKSDETIDISTSLDYIVVSETIF